MGLKLNTASSGSVTLEPANTASNYTLTVPAQTGTVVATDASGNVGIGTSSPLGKLTSSSASFGGTISANANQVVAENSGNAGMTIASGATSLGNLFFADSGDTADGFVQYDQSGRSMRFGTATAERMRIDSSGNLLVGTTSAFVSTTGICTYTFNSGINTNTSNIGNTAGTAYHWTFNRGTPGSQVEVGSIRSASNATTYATSSDYRLKEDVQPMTNALAKVATLKPCIYKWKSDGSDGEGFIAHELQEVCPQAVVGEKDAINEDGSIKPQGIDTSFLVATLTAAIQELKAQLDESNLILTSVKTELDTVKTELATLKGQA